MNINTKTVAIWAIVALVLLIGGYFIYKSMSSAAPAASNGTATTTATVDPNQVQAQEVTVGTGLEAKPGDTVSVLYVGQLQDGTVFDSSAAHDNQPLTFVLGAQGLIPGFQIGVNGMKEGGERLLAIPPALGYGTTSVKDASGKEIIPANSTIVFDVKLVKVQPADATATQ